VLFNLGRLPQCREKLLAAGRAEDESMTLDIELNGNFHADVDGVAVFHAGFEDPLGDAVNGSLVHCAVTRAVDHMCIPDMAFRVAMKPISNAPGTSSNFISKECSPDAKKRGIAAGRGRKD
jgi:hypothetical protein